MRRSLKFGLFALVIAGLIGGSVAWASLDKTVKLTVDGKTQEVSTYASTVSGVLDDAGITIKKQDSVTPAPKSTVKDGAEVVLIKGRPLALTVDGVDKDVWVTALSVDEALDQLGYDDAYVSASRSQRVPLDGLELEVRTPKLLNIAADGKQLIATSTAANVGEALKEQKIAIAPTDTVAPTVDQPLTNAMKIVVTRTNTSQVQEVQPIPFETEEQPDDTMFTDEEEILTPGVDGEKLVTFDVTVIDGVETARTVVSEVVTREPVKEVKKVGTKVRPDNTGAEPPPNDGSLNWDALAQCESSGNWQANTGNGYYGGIQFNISTWMSNGGGDYAERPDLATREQQIAIGQNLYDARGIAPWPHCGPRLYD